MAKALTVRTVETARPRFAAGGTAARTEIPDGGSHGLYLILHPSGRRAWAVRYRINGRSRKLTLPGFATLAEARKAASEAMLDVANGVDPATKHDAQVAQACTDAARKAGDTVENLIERFVTLHVSQRRENTRRTYVSIFDKIVLPLWRRKSVHEIERRDVIALLDRVAESRPVIANRTLSLLHTWFAWMVARGVVQNSPVVGVKRPTQEVARDRILDDGEIRSLWRACGEIGNVRIEGAIKLLLLTGQRRSEVLGMRRDEIADGVWTLPRERVKNNREHVVPLSTQATAIIASMPGHGDLIFGPLSNSRIAQAKAVLDVTMKLSRPWVYHDLRRSCASGMAGIGVNLPVIEKVLNHQSGSFAGIVSVYQRHDYLAEKTAALQRWADHVERTVAGTSPGGVATQ